MADEQQDMNQGRNFFEAFNVGDSFIPPGDYPPPSLEEEGDYMIKMILETIKNDMKNDIEKFPNDKRNVANARFGLGVLDFFVKYKKAFETFRDSPFHNVGDEVTARRVGKAMSKINTILKTEGILESDFLKDFIFLEIKRLNEADEQNRELGKCMEEGWNSESN